MDIKDRSFFRFCTGKALKFGSRDGRIQYITNFWLYMMAARTNASQKAFQDMQEELANAGKTADERAERKKKRIRYRRARMDDAMTVGDIIDVHLEYNDDEHCANFLFGIKKPLQTQQKNN